MTKGVGSRLNARSDPKSLASNNGPCAGSCVRNKLKRLNSSLLQNNSWKILESKWVR
jgi:hypothetical protein